MMSEEKKAWVEFCEEQQLDNHLPFVRNLAWVAWRRAFDMGYRLASEATHEGTPDNDNPCYVPKSDGATTGYIKKVNESAEFALGLSVIALTISVVALITTVVHLF